MKSLVSFFHQFPAKALKMLNILSLLQNAFKFRLTNRNVKLISIIVIIICIPDTKYLLADQHNALKILKLTNKPFL